MKLYSVKEAKEILGIKSDRTMGKLLRSGEIRGAKIGREWRISEEDLRTFYKNHLNTLSPNNPL